MVAVAPFDPRSLGICDGNARPLEVFLTQCFMKQKKYLSVVDTNKFILSKF